MKKSNLILILILIVCVMAAFATGCGKDREEVIAGYEEIISEALNGDDTAGEEKLADIEKYLDKNLKYVDPEDADYMIFSYSETAWEIGIRNIDNHKIKEKYSAYMSDMMNDFMEIEILDEDKPLTKGDEGTTLNCEWNDIADRAMATEKIIKKYSGNLNSESYQHIKEHIAWHYEHYVNLMLIGTSENPLFSYETGEFDKSADDMYTRIAQENHDTVTAWALNEFFRYLDDIRYNLDYKNASESKTYYDTCNYIVKEAGKRVFQ